MEAAIILGLLGYGMHQYIDHNDKPTTQYVYSTQTTEDVESWSKINNQIKTIAQVDWSKAGNSKVGDSPETGVQWVFITGGE